MIKILIDSDSHLRNQFSCLFSIFWKALTFIDLSSDISVLKIIFKLFWFLIESMFYLLNRKQIFINEYEWSIKQMNSAANIDKLWTKTSSNFISLNWRTAKSLMTFYLKKIYCEFLRTCTWNYYKKCMINLQSLISTIINHWSSSAFLLLIRSSSYYSMIHLKLSCLSAKQSL